MRPEFLRNDVDVMILDIVRQGLEIRAHELPAYYLQLLVGLLSGSNDAREFSASFPFNNALSPFWFHVDSAISWAAPAMDEREGKTESDRRVPSRPLWDDSARECLARAREVLHLSNLPSHETSTPDH